jgi:hypothetical protein
MARGRGVMECKRRLDHLNGDRWGGFSYVHLSRYVSRIDFVLTILLLGIFICAFEQVCFPD